MSQRKHEQAASRPARQTDTMNLIKLVKISYLVVLSVQKTNRLAFQEIRNEEEEEADREGESDNCLLKRTNDREVIELGDRHGMLLSPSCVQRDGICMTELLDATLSFSLM